MSLPAAFDANANATVVVPMGDSSISAAVCRTPSARCRTTFGTTLHVPAPYEMSARNIPWISGPDALHPKPQHDTAAHVEQPLTA